MILFHSGGGSPWLPEMQSTGDPAVMLSAYVNTHQKTSKKPDSRLRKLLKARRKAKKEKA